MSQRLSQKVVNTFIKGLITEAGELTFPEDASIDELNCLLERDGTRRRRLAVGVEENNVLSTFTVNNNFEFTSGLWDNVAGQAGLEFIVVQNGSTLYFYNISSEPYSDNQKSFSVNMSTFEQSGSAGAGTAKVQVASINGDLVVVSEAINPFYITYDPQTDTITTDQIIPRTRDFEWQGDTSTYSTEEASPSDARTYDTTNAGWTGAKGTAALTAYESANSAYPPLTHPWYSGKNSDGNFSESEWRKVYSGTSLTGNGHFILDFFNKVRVGLTTETESTRFKTVAAFSGRVFYAGLTSSKNGGRILFSKQLDNITEAGRCYQQNDPTSEEISDLLDTDGGVILLPDAYNIQKLHVFGPTLFVFAENGVWQISGVDNVFRATEYSISKVTQIGINNASTFVSVEGVPMWWSKHGIHTVSFDEVSGKGQEQNLSISTIQKFFDKIDGNAKDRCVATYDATNKRAHWFYPNNGEGVFNKKNRVLTLDISIQAFYPWEVSDSTPNTDYIIGAQYLQGFGSDFVDFDVYTAAGDDVVTSSGDDVVINKLSQLAQADSSIGLMIFDAATSKMTMGFFQGTDFLDWGDANYSSYAEAGYDFLGDLVLKKNAPYIQVYLRPTETGFVGSDELGYNPVRESSLLVSSYWDFRNNTSSTPQQAYRLKYVPVVNESALNTWDYPENVVTTRLKMRGHGRSMRLRFESEQGKDFVLLGFGIISAANQRF
jgi:hypothetical protein